MHLTDSKIAQEQISQQHLINWEKPLASWYKLNFDGSKYQDKSSAIGYVIRDDTAQVKILGVKWCGYTSVLVAKALALKEGVGAAKFMGINKLEIESDNLCIKKVIQNTWKI